MKYALLIYSAPGASEAPGAETREGWIDYTRAVKEAGILLGVEQLAETDTATSVRLRGGQRLLTDGPFLETKEHLAGFFLIDVPDLDTAVDWAARMPHAASGTAEVRAVRTGMAWQAMLG
ncbi:MAG: YciI family protein [Streptosporangiaceae bacterium]